MERTEALNGIAQRIEDMIRTYGCRSDVTITYERVTSENIGNFTEFQRDYHGLLAAEEYFLIWVCSDPNAAERRVLLYTVCITCDSLLTAAKELMDIVSRKF